MHAIELVADKQREREHVQLMLTESCMCADSMMVEERKMVEMISTGSVSSSIGFTTPYDVIGSRDYTCTIYTYSH